MKIYALSNSYAFTNLLVEKLNETTNNFSFLKIRKQKFADGEINVVFDESIRGETLVIVAQIEMPYENLFELIFTLDAARRSAAKEIIVVIPYLPHSRQERRDDKRAPISARVIADILQNAGADRIISMDIHTSAIEGFYSIPFDKLYPFEIYVKFIKKMNIENLCLASPDFGFIKKMEKYQNELKCDMVVINKDRRKANEIEKMELIGDVTGKNIILIDDLIDTATTLVKATELLIAKGALSVNVFATHGVLSEKDGSSAELKLQESKIKQTYVSNTIYKRNVANDLKNARVSYIDVTSIFANAILKIEKE